MSAAIPVLQSAPPSTAAARVPFGGIAAALLIVAYTFFLIAHFSPGISEPDDNGYYAQGTLIAQTGHTWFIPQSDAQYIGMHWLLTPSGKYVSRYPPGLPVIIAAVYKGFGWKAAVFVNPMLGIAGLAGFYFLLKQALGRFAPDGGLATSLWAVAGVLILAANPQYLHHALSGDAHVGVACFLMWGLYFLLRWGEEKKPWLAFAAGLLLGVIPTIRYPDAIMALGIGVFMLAQWRGLKKPWLHFLVAGAGAMIPMLPLMIRNQLLLGAFYRTGYSLTSEQTGFGWDYFQENALPYIQTINGDGIGLLFSLGLIGMLIMLWVRERHALGAALVLMAVPMLLVYMSYYWAPQGNGGATMRFLIPTFPLYILAGLWLVRHGMMALPWPGRATVAAALVLVQICWGFLTFRQQAERLAYQKETLARVTTALENVAEPGDVVLASNIVGQQLDFVRKWKVADQNAYRAGPIGPGGGPGNPQPAGQPASANGAGVDEQGDNEAPSPQQVAKMIERSKNYTGDNFQRERKYMADIEKWAAGKKIWIIGTQEQVLLYSSQREGVLPLINIQQRVKLPDPPAIEPGNGQGRGGRGGRGQFAGGQGGGPGGGPQGGAGPQGGGIGGPQGAGPGLAGGRGQGNPQGQFIPGQGRGGRGGLAGGQGGPQGGQGPQGGGQGPGRGGRGGGPFSELNGETELVIGQWILQR